MSDKSVMTLLVYYGIWELFFGEQWNNERHNASQLPTIPIPIDDYVTPTYDKQNYTVKSHGAHVMSGPYESIGQYDVLTKQTNENLKQQCDKALHELNQLRRQHTETSRRYDDLIENHNATLEKLRLVQEENTRLKTQCHDLTQERNAVVANVVRQWEGGARERADMKRLTDERNAAMAEYTLIMSERQDNSAYHHLGLASGVGLSGLAGDSADKERVDNLEQANQELQRLRKQLDRALGDLTDAVSKRRRDWAFSERDKLLQERESVKALCNRLRKLADARRHGGGDKPRARGDRPERPERPAPARRDCWQLADARRHGGGDKPRARGDRPERPERPAPARRDCWQVTRHTGGQLADARRHGGGDKPARAATGPSGPSDPRQRAATAGSGRAAARRRRQARARGDRPERPERPAPARRDCWQLADARRHGGGDKPRARGDRPERPERPAPARRDCWQVTRHTMGGQLADARRHGGGDKPRARGDRPERPERPAPARRDCWQVTRHTMGGQLADARRHGGGDKPRARGDRPERPERPAPARRDCWQVTRHTMGGQLADARRHGGGDKPRARGDRPERPERPAPARRDCWQDIEWDMIDVELSGLGKDGELGFELAGGRDDPYFPDDSNIYRRRARCGPPSRRARAACGCSARAPRACAPRCAPQTCARSRCSTVGAAPPSSAAAGALRAALAQGACGVRLQRARTTRLRAALRPADLRAVTLQHGRGQHHHHQRRRRAAGRLAQGACGVRLQRARTTRLRAALRPADLRAVTLQHGRGQHHHHQRRRARCGPPSRRARAACGCSARAPRACAPRCAPQTCARSRCSTALRACPKCGRCSTSVNTILCLFRSFGLFTRAVWMPTGTWDMIRGKIEAVTGRSKSKDKQNKVPESDAIAELDSVIDSYHGKTIKETSIVLKRSRRKNKEPQNDSKNGGTWPKARANFVLEENPTGTIVQPRSRKERPPLSILLSPPTKLQPEPQRSNTNRNSNPIPLGHAPLTQATAPARHSVYKSIESSPAIAHFPKPAPLSIHNPHPQFSSPNSMNFEKIRTLEKDKISMSDYSEHDITPNRLSLALNPSDDSLDYQPVTRNRTKSPHSLDFIVNKGPSSLDFISRKTPTSLEQSMKNHPILEQYYSTKKSSSPKTVNKYPSDSDSFGPDSLNSNANFAMTGTLPSQSRLQSQYYRGPFVNSNPHTSSRYPHLASPTNIPQSQSGESIGTSYEMHSFPSHTHNMSDLQPVPRANRVLGDYHHTYEGGTFPRKKENQRFRIPSNPSVTSKNSAGKLSTGSIERSSERNSPMPTYHVEILSPGRGAKQMMHKATRNSMPEYTGLGWNKPLPGELRRVHIDKSQQPLGIQIYCPPSSGGVFVSTVNENSLASQVGLQVGDQLLEVCGINMRSATYTLAASVLRQIGNSITMLVQYSPEKYKDEVEVSGSSSSGESSHDEEVSLSGSPTPRNSPGPQQSLRMETPSAEAGTLRQSQASKDLPRFLLIEMRNCSDLGISLVGGNAVGIFVHSVQIDSPAFNAGLRTGDQILEYNNVDLRRATAEQAALELAKPAEKVSVLVRHDLQQYHDIKDKPGDAFYIRAGFDRCAKITSIGVDTIDEYSLWFRKDEVLFVDNTLFNGAPGLWRAWQLDCKGGEAQRRASTTARRSFFRRKKHRDSKELASFSNTELGCWSDSGALADDAPLLHRPVVVLGPLRECVVGKLVSDWAGVFARVRPQPLPLRGAALERALAQGSHLEPRPTRDNTHYDTIPLQAIKDKAEKLVSDWAGVFARVRPQPLPLRGAALERALAQGSHLEPRPTRDNTHYDTIPLQAIKDKRRSWCRTWAGVCARVRPQPLPLRGAALERALAQGSHLEPRPTRDNTHFDTIPLQAIKDKAEKGVHCILDISVATIEKLHKQQIYPIVLFIKFKSFKQIKEVKDTRYPADKVSAKAAKEMYEHGLKIENEYRSYISEDRDMRYYSDPGRDVPRRKPKEQKSDSTDSDLKYYSEPDAKNYFEIDYEFLKELRRIARNNCPKCRRKRSRSTPKDKLVKKDKAKSKPARSVRVKENYVYCNGRYHSDQEHCRLCCRICNRSTDTLDSIEDDQYSLVSKSYSLPSSRATTSSRSKSTPKNTRERKNSTQSIKSVSFLESSNDESRKDEPNYTAKSFTNDLKQFLLKPSPPRLSLRDKFIISFKQEFEATKKSPKLKAIKGLWKSY
ncbi:hypothetical protein MSG28_013443 [Choristoneura fumiferana]|uniref:Uncharacterized protein n=1 Tax=Choristoneura fumiferana TaxID=7141 RepID=A0ACC0KTW8_CHOFU|nr:hypothetical protein MSG28_013443 [Choristoneura fumiferana]